VKPPSAAHEGRSCLDATPLQPDSVQGRGGRRQSRSDAIHRGGITVDRGEQRANLLTAMPASVVPTDRMFCRWIAVHQLGQNIGIITFSAL